MTDLKALGLVPFLMSVHYKPEYTENLKQGMVGAKYPVKILSDNQAILIVGEECRLVGIGEEINL